MGHSECAGGTELFHATRVIFTFGVAIFVMEYYVYEVVAEDDGKVLCWWCGYNTLTDFPWMDPNEIGSSLLADFRTDPKIQKRTPAIQQAYRFLTTKNSVKKWKRKRDSLGLAPVRSAFL
jgi:hypothetical protein